MHPWRSLTHIPAPSDLVSRQTNSLPTQAARGKNAAPTLISILLLLTFISAIMYILWPMMNGMIHGEEGFLVFFGGAPLKNALFPPGEARPVMSLIVVVAIEEGFMILLLGICLFAAAFIVIAGCFLMIKIGWSLLSALFKFVRLGMARAFQLFLQCPGAWIMGKVVRNAAFGGQCKKVSRPQELPEKERARSEAISGNLNQKMNDLSRKTAAQAGEALYSALAEGDASQIKDHVRARLTDPKLAHCQYYCEDEIINRVAELIVSPPSSLTSGFDLSKRNGSLSAP